jgi:hypothetical protein
MSFFRRQAEPFLPDADYLSATMPTTDLEVLMVLARERGILRRFSTLPTVFTSASSAEDIAVTRDQTVVAVRGTASRKMKIGIGASIAAGLISALGGKSIGAHLMASRAKSIEFGYTDVTADRVDLGSLDHWLAAADFNPQSHSTADLLASENMFVIVGLLKARGVSVKLLDDNEQSLSVDLPVIADAVGAQVTTGASGERNTTLTFSGKSPLGVGVKAAQIKVEADGGFWINSRLSSKGEVRGFGGAGPSYLTADHGELTFG